jgi:hypothetical protein
MADPLPMHRFITQLWDGEICFLLAQVAQEQRRRATRIGPQDGMVRACQHIALATASVIDTATKRRRSV